MVGPHVVDDEEQARERREPPLRRRHERVLVRVVGEPPYVGPGKVCELAPEHERSAVLPWRKSWRGRSERSA